MARRMFIVGKRGRKEMEIHGGGGGGDDFYELGLTTPRGGDFGGGRGGQQQGDADGNCGDPYIRDTQGNIIRRRGGPGAAYSAERVEVRERTCFEAREFPIGFNETITAGQTEGIESKPQVMYRGERLSIGASRVGNFDVTDIKVGKDSQLAADGNLDGETFSNLSIGVRMVLDTAEPGILIILEVENTDTHNDHDFKAVMFGTVIE